MNIEESIMYLKIKINTSKKQIESGEIWLDSLVSEEKNSNEAIETLLTAYEKEKEENVKLRLQDIPFIEGELKAYKDRVNELKQQLKKEKEKNINLIDTNKKLYEMGKQNAIQEIINNDYTSNDKIKAKIEENKWAIEHYDCDEADYKQSQAVGAWNVLQRLLKESEIWNEKKID